MADKVGGEGPASHTPQQQQLYTETHAAYNSGRSIIWFRTELGLVSPISQDGLEHLLLRYPINHIEHRPW